jgi:hypothetical protein
MVCRKNGFVDMKYFIIIMVGLIVGSCSSTKCGFFVNERDYQTCMKTYDRGVGQSF